MPPNPKGACNLRHRLPLNGGERLCLRQPERATSSAAQKVMRGGCLCDWCRSTGAGGAIVSPAVASLHQRCISQEVSIPSMPQPEAVQGNGSHGDKWSGAPVRYGMHGWEALVDAGTSTSENMHNGSQNIIDSYQSGCQILTMGTQDVYAWFRGMG